MLGHDAQVTAFLKALSSGRPHHAWLLTGPRGIGKGQFARKAAARMLAHAAGESDGADTLDIAVEGQTAKLIAAESHPDFRIVERLVSDRTSGLARSITVDQIRSLRALFATTPSLASCRVIIIDSVDDLEKGGANALLKSLEEPPRNTVFFLVSHAPGRLLPTIRSRCRQLSFRPLNDATMDAILAETIPDASRRSRLAALAKGIPADALAIAALDMAAIEDGLVAIAADGDPTNARRCALAQSLALKAAASRYEAFLRRVPAFIAERARCAEGDRLERALDAWSATEQLARHAIPQSLVAETVVFEMAGHVAALAPSDDAAKA